MKRNLLTIFLMLTLFRALAQYAVSGVVTDGQEALPGATIQLKGTDFGSVSQVDGSYRFENLPGGSYEMEVRSMGFVPKTIQLVVEGHRELNVVLSESALAIDAVVVTGTMQPTFVSQSPVKVEVITSKYLNTFMPAAASSVVSGISLVNGVREVVACGVCFTNSISINGLPGPYTAVLMDGAPIYGNLASVYGLNGIPNMIIDRFEVIKGPSSTLYGSEAVAGVINIITKDPGTQPALSLDVMGTSHMETFGNLSFAPKIGNASGFLGLNYAYINDFDDRNDDGFGDNVNLDRISLFTKWNIPRKSGKRFTISGKYYYEDRRNGVETYLTDRNYQTLRGSDSVYGESIYTSRGEVFGTYELPWISNVRLDFSASIHAQDSYYGADGYQANQNILFGNFIWNKEVGDHDLLSGLTLRNQYYDDNTVATENQENANQFIPGVFAQDEWKVANNFSILGGLRIDHYKDHGLIPAPRLNLKYKPGEWTTIRTNFGTGFRIVNLFTEDHAFVTGQREVVITEDLLPEESYNFSLNLNHVYTLGMGQGMIDIDGFYTYFTNKITPDYSSPDQIVYANIDGFAVSKGIGVSIQQEFSFPLAVNFSVNFQDVEITENQQVTDVEFSPAWSGVFTANYRLNAIKLNIAYTATYTGPMALPEVYDLDVNGDPLGTPRPTKSGVFSIHSLQITKGLSKGFSIYGGVQNLFDYVQPWSPLTGFNDPAFAPGFSDQFDTAYAYSPIHGREIYIGLKWDLIR